MKDLTYTIIHIEVGAEKDWEEVEGFVSGDKESLQLKSYNAYLFDLAELYSEKRFRRGGCEQHDLSFAIQFKEEERVKHWLKQNHSHPLSELANKLGAKIYGGFEDEKDFYLLLPTARDLKAGDFSKDFLIGFGEYVAWRRQYNYGFYCIQASNKEVMFIAYEKDYVFPKKGNIFQEYARTGIIENDLYKQFIK
jgi:hypothetical protein